MLMQAYRHAYATDGKKSKLSQEGLLKLMGQVDPIYLERYNHSTVARWESGATRPTKERLEAFGKALDLSVAEVQGMIWLAGFRDNAEEPDLAESASLDLASTPESSAVKDGPATGAVDGFPTHTSRLARYILTKFALPGLVVAAIGYILARLGWNAGWIMALYVSMAVVLVMVQGFLSVRRSHELREIYFLTVFLLISGNLLQAPATRMDPYGFYAMGEFANTPIPYLIATLLNMVLALIAGLMFDYLWRWQYQSGRGFKNIYHRAAWTAFPPLLFVYGFILFFSCLGMLIYLMLVFSIMGGTFMAILALRDKETMFRNWERKLLMQAAMGVILLLTAIGAGSILVAYLEPSPLAIPDHTLVRSWEIDFDALGYSPDELLERHRVGAVWSSMGTLLYMAIVLGGSLMATIYRLGQDESADQEPTIPENEVLFPSGNAAYLDPAQSLQDSSDGVPAMHE